MTVFISDMDTFSRMNNVYKKYFGSNPPGRACVAVDLPPDVHIRIHALAYSENNPLSRKALHVQGLSYWAPANIGPYSQSVAVLDCEMFQWCMKLIAVDLIRWGITFLFQARLA